MNQAGIDRRTLLRGAAGAAVTTGLGMNLTMPASGAEITRDYATRETYDWAEAYFWDNYPNLGPGQLDGGNLSWTQSYVLRSYLVMYQAFGDTHYLDLFIRNADQILGTRNSVLGVTDYRGLSRPVWRIRDPYTVGIVDLVTADGAPLVRIRSGATGANRAQVAVQVGSGAGLFTVAVTTRGGTSDTFTDVTMDPDSPNYLVTRMRAINPGFSISTAVDLRANPVGTDVPVPGTYTLTTQFYDGAVNSGMLVAPMAEFASIARRDKAMQTGIYADRAAVYAEAAKDAIDCFDEDYRVGRRAEAWYIWARSCPFYLDGTELPHNQYIVLATAMTHLAEAIHLPRYRERARRMLRTLYHDLRVDGDAYIWPYWWSKGEVYQGYTYADDVSDHAPSWPGTKRIEDASHGMIDLEAVLTGYRHGLVFKEHDLRRFAATFVDNVQAYTPDGVPTLNNLVDGTGGTGNYDLVAPVWTLVAPWNRRVFTFARELYNARQYVPSQAHILWAIALLAAQAGK